MGMSSTAATAATSATAMATPMGTGSVMATQHTLAAMSSPAATATALPYVTTPAVQRRSLTMAATTASPKPTETVHIYEIMVIKSIGLCFYLNTDKP